MRTRRWVRKWSHDLEADGFSPLPTQVISNEEYVPLPQTFEQQRVAGLLEETARAVSRRRPTRATFCRRTRWRRRATSSTAWLRRSGSSHGLVAPIKGTSDLDEMRRQADELTISAWKGYTG